MVTALLYTMIKEIIMKLEFRKFEPISNNASIKIQDLLSRGGHVIKEKREYVEILRYQSIAKIDQHGRVEWRAYA